ncbi:MAG: transcriptional regulator [Candidatus Bathyarchaeia archaeon]
MKTFIKCELCNANIPSGEKCVFAVHKRIIDGEEHYFCCEHHADEFERKRGTQR